MGWNFDISEAPKGEFVDVTRRIKGEFVDVREYRPEKIIVATNCGKVITSRWIPANGPDGDRWEGFSKGQNPIAWQHYPAHPKVEGDHGPR